MARKEIIFILLFFLGVSVLFFYKTFFYGLIPFPGDLLIAEYYPWKSYSFLGYNPGSFPHKAQYFDTLRQIYPWKTLVIDMVKRGEVPLWNPYNFSGHPLLANSQSAVLYPLNILYLFLSRHIAWAVLIMLQPLISGMGTYLFTRKIGIGIKGSLFAGSIFSYSIFMNVFLEYNTIGHVIAWLPLMLFSIEYLLEKMRPYGILLLAISIICSFFAGHLQVFGYVFGLVTFYTLFRLRMRPGKKRAKGIQIFTILLLAIGVCSIQFLPTLELIQYAARSPQEYAFVIEKLLIQPWQMIMLFSPDFFGNPATRNYLLADSYPGNALSVSLFGIVFALLSLFAFRKNMFVRFFSILSGVVLILIVRSPLTEFIYHINIPVLSTSSPNNMLFLLAFCTSILGGIGLELFLQQKNKKFIAIPLSIILLFGIIWLSGIVENFTFNKTNFVLSSGIAVVLLGIFILRLFIGKVREMVFIICVLVSVVELFYFFQKFNPFIPKQLVFPHTEILSILQEKQRLDRFWGYGAAGIEANVATQFSLFSPEGYDPLYPAAYGRFLYSSRNGEILETFTNQTRSDAVIDQGSGKDLAKNPNRQKVLQMLGVRYILDKSDNNSTEETFPGKQFRLLYDKNGWKLFENTYAAPRVFLTTKYQTYKTNNEFEKIFFGKEFDPGKQILLEEKVDSVTPDENTGRVNVLSYKENTIHMQTAGNTNALLFISDTFFPGWKAFVDGKETKIYKANYAFRAIVLSKGEHTVIFDYKPVSFLIGSVISIISIGGLMIACFVLPRIKL